MAAIGGDQGIVGLVADALELRGLDVLRIRTIADPDRISIKQAVSETPARQIDQTHHAGQFSRRVFGRDVGHELQRVCVEHLHATGFVVLCGHQRAVCADRATDGVARLHDPPRDALLKQVHLCETTVASENIGVEAIAGKHHRGVREVTQAGDFADQGLRRGVNQVERAIGTADDQAEVACASMHRCGAALQGAQQSGGRQRQCCG